jgi:hypothetical protein
VTAGFARCGSNLSRGSIGRCRLGWNRQERRRRGQTGAPQARKKVAPQARAEGSQGQVRSVASTPPLDQSPKSARAPQGRQPRAVVFCRPCGPEFLLLAIQGLRATRSEHAAPGSSPKSARAPQGRQPRAVVLCRPCGPEFLLLTIQGLRATRLPLATFCPRLRRSVCVTC